jgi:hypothetical protein
MLAHVNRHRASLLFCTAAVMAALCIPSAASAASYDFPLSGYWPLNEGKGQVVRDWSGNGNHGQLGSTPGVDANDPSWIKGAFFWSYGLHFDGGDFVSIRDSNDLEPQQLTVSTWFRGSSTPGNYKYLVAKGSNECSTASYGLYTGPNGGLAFYVGDGQPYGFTVSDDAGQGVWDGKWHNASGTFDGNIVRLFIDGKEIGSGMARGGDRLRHAQRQHDARRLRGLLRPDADRRPRRGLDLEEGTAGGGDLEEVQRLLRSALSRDKLRSPRGCSSAGRASGWQPEGQGFEPPQLHCHEAVRKGGLGR